MQQQRQRRNARMMAAAMGREFEPAVEGMADVFRRADPRG